MAEIEVRHAELPTWRCDVTQANSHATLRRAELTRLAAQVALLFTLFGQVMHRGSIEP